jgi:hypothetical protein
LLKQAKGFKEGIETLIFKLLLMAIPSPLEGEGQDEGADKSTPYLLGFPHPNPLPMGEGIMTAVT